MSLVVRCDTCGGTIVYDAAREAACCLFCGSTSLEREVAADDSIPKPYAALTGRVDAASADQQFRQWASASWWTPSALRNSAIQLQAMFLPAWWARGQVESHWSGTIRAHTQSGRAPTSGVDVGRYEDMVPASQGISEPELNELQPFNPADCHAWNEAASAQPYEPPALSEQASHAWLTERMRASHLRDIIQTRGLHDAVSSSLVHEEGHALYMVPIYIGAVRFRDRPWRFLINAQSGEVVGKAPIDRVKIALACLGTAALAAITWAIIRFV